MQRVPDSNVGVVLKELNRSHKPLAIDDLIELTGFKRSQVQSVIDRLKSSGEIKWNKYGFEVAGKSFERTWLSRPWRKHACD